MRSLCANLKKKKVLEYLHDGQSARDIAKKLQLSHTSVLRLGKVNNVERIGVSKGGRPKKITMRDARHIGMLLNANKLSSPKEGLSLLHQKVSVWTLRRALRQAGYKAKEKQKKPALSAKNISARKAFLRRQEHWTVDDWKRVIWSDETKINRFQSDGRSWYWTNSNGPLQAHQVNQTIKFGGGCLMVWGCITHFGVGPIVKIDGKMNKDQYLRILQTNLPVAVDMLRMQEKRVLFQQDNDPKHSSKVVQNWLRSQAFQTLEWPPQSPDMNPIENLWSFLKRQLANYANPPKGMQELWERIQEEWFAIPPDYIQNLYESMPRRLQDLKKSRGLWTKY